MKNYIGFIGIILFVCTIQLVQILKEGFNPKYFTHYWKNQKGDVYLFCYEFGFLEKQENRKSKYVLVQWQDYMG